MESARTLEAVVATDESPLAHARLKRQLTIDDCAELSRRISDRSAKVCASSPLTPSSVRAPWRYCDTRRINA